MRFFKKMIAISSKLVEANMDWREPLN